MTRKSNRRQRVRRKNPDLEHLRPGAHCLTIRKSTYVGDADDARDGRLRYVVRAKQRSQLDPRADLLLALANRGCRGILIVIDEAAGQAPQAMTRFDGTTPEHDSACRLDDHGGGHLRVAPQDKRVVRASLMLASFDELRDERRSAVDAEVGHSRRA